MGINRRDFLVSSAGAALAGALSPANKSWNIVFILLDDMGWRDLACYGSRFYESPNIDRLALQGMRFTNAYAAAPLCSPTRASIMTGKYPVRLGMTNITGYHPNRKGPWISPETASEMSLDEVTIAECLKTEHYATALIGKWHLGKKPFWPENQGFDVNIGGTEMAMPPHFFYPEWSMPGGHFNVKVGVPIEGKPGEYLTDRLTDEALRFVESKKDRPFFLYLAHYAVHVPIEAKQDMIAKFRAKADPTDPQHNPVYAAMIQSVDEGVGRIMKKLAELGIADHTLVVLTSDNGGLIVEDGPNGPPTSNLPLRGGKMSLYEGGIREPLIIKWPGMVKPGSVCDVAVISNDFYPTLAEIAGVRKDPGHPLDGVSLVPLLKGARGLNRKALYWHYPHTGYFSSKPAGWGAVRQGDYKLLEPFDENPLELYDLSRDIGETRNLAGEMPQKANELMESLHAWQKSVNAKRLTRNPDYHN